MADTLTLKFSDTITGGSQLEERPGELDILPFSFGIRHPGALEFSNKGSNVTGRAALTPIHLSMRMDESTPSIMKCAAEGKEIATATISALGNGGSGPKATRQKLTLSNVIIGDVSADIMGEGQPTVHFTLYYKEFSFDYVSLDDKNVEQAAKTVGYNQVTGKIK